MTTRVAERPPIGTLGADGDSYRGRLQILVLLERPNPARWTLRQVACFAGRLGAELLVASVATYDRELDDLDRLNVQIAKDGVEEVTSWLRERGARTAGTVRLETFGDRTLSAVDLADHLDADLVIVLARRGSWFRVFPGSPLVHQLMRQRRRPVLVIADQVRHESWLRRWLGLVKPEPARP